MNMRIVSTLAVLAIGAALAQTSEPPPIKRTLLQRMDVGGNLELNVGLAEIAPGGTTGRHTHFGVESGYVLQGSASMQVEGEPDRALKAGDSYAIAAGKAHEARALGAEPAKVIASYVVEKGKPLATPAP